jgi:hypothetical protein
MPTGALVTFSLNFLSAVVALLTSYYAYRTNRLVANAMLRAVSLGFMLLGVGLMAEAVTSLFTGKVLVEFYAERLFVLYASFAYLTIQMVAYLVIALGYWRTTYGKEPGPALLVAPMTAVAVGLYNFSLLSYFVTLILLGLVVFQGFLLRSGSRSRFSGTVLLAFVLILVAHVILFASVLISGAGLFLVGALVQFTGFLSLLVFVVRSEVVGAG